ncbi:MAG TPA: helicase-related protein, partial [Chondromyces sp.]|nr:helicase-related protein [Chondromyces sp.]
RKVENVEIEFTKEERVLYDSLQSLRENIEGGAASAFSIMTLQREACSSREAVYMTLKNMLQKTEQPNPAYQEKILSLMKLVENVQQNSKAAKALELIKSINDKVIIFTEYRATQLYLQWFLKQHGISSVPFRGGFKRGKKDWMRELFEKQAQVLIATEAGGEGLNLQFCHHIINFDLPWNPMRLEQRIGRIHRLGQEKDVHIYNFAVRDTMENHVLHLLYEKIRLFEQVVGELDQILTRLDIGKMEDHLADIFQNSKSEGEMKVKMENFSALLELAHEIKEGDDQHGETRNTSIS